MLQKLSQIPELIIVGKGQMGVKYHAQEHYAILS